MRSIAFILLAASAVVGCGQLLPSSLLAAKSAENPLQGAALEWTRAPSGVPFEGARACTIWPIQDALTVSATTEKICVKGQVHRLLPPSVTPPAVDTVVVHSDGGGTSEQLDGRAGAISSAAPKKLGECTDHGAAKSIWAHPFDGCIDNKDKDGKPWVSATSTFLDIGLERWRFASGATPASAPSAAPAK